MNELVRAVTGLLGAVAARLTGGPLIYIEHLGTINNAAEVDDDCDCGDPDAPQSTFVLLPIEAAKDLFVEAIRRHGNGAGDPEDVGWDMARTLELGGDVA